MNSILKNKFQYSFDELNNMLPYEREIYVALLMKQLHEEKEEAEKRNQ